MFCASRARVWSIDAAGGVVQLVGEKSFELVVKPDSAEVYVVDAVLLVAADQSKTTARFPIK